MGTSTTGRGLALVAAAFLLAGCGESGAAPEADGQATSLEVRVDLGDGSKASEATLSCPDGEATGYLEGKGADACQDLEQGAAALFPDPERVCTQQYGGPERAEIKGTYEGRDVDVVVTRSDGCGIADWAGLGGVLPGVG